MRDGTVKTRLTDAAFELFDERGFEQTTVSEIAERAGVGRTTVFRSFPSKEELIFPDHERLLTAVRERLASASEGTAEVAVFEALAVVLRSFIGEGDRAKLRYRLSRTVAALADREAASVLRYQRLFYAYFQNQLLGQDDASLRAELAASAAVTAHNHVLRRWLRGHTTEPERELRSAVRHALAVIRDPATRTGETSVLVIRTEGPPEDVVAALQQTLGPSLVHPVATKPATTQRRTRP